jgi:hypothetical protein
VTVRGILQSAADKGVQLALTVNEKGKEKISLIHSQTPEPGRTAERVRTWVREATPEIRQAIFDEIRKGGKDLLVPEFREVDELFQDETTEELPARVTETEIVREPVARPARAAGDPVLYETPEMQRARRLREGMEALTRNTVRVSTEVEEGLTVEWRGEGFNIGAGVFVYPSGRRSMHWFEEHEQSGETRCDCQAKKKNFRVPCKHEILRQREIDRRASEALIKAGEETGELEI